MKPQADWTILTEDLRMTVERYIGVPQMQSMGGPFGTKSKYQMADYDAAIRERDTKKLLNILNDAWLRAPENHTVYDDPGFCLLCDICDGSKGNFMQELET